MDSTTVYRTRGSWAALAVALLLPWMVMVPETQAQPTPSVVRYNGGRYDRSGAIVTTPDGSFVVAGSVEIGSTQPSFAAVKFDRDGNRLWRTNYSGSAGGSLGQGFDVAVDGQGNFFVAGYVSVGFFATETDLLVVKFDANGVEQWARRYNGPGNGPDVAASIVVDLGGNVYVSGYSYGSGIDWVTQKFASNGTVLWTRRHSGLGHFDDRVSDAGLDAAGNLVVTGTTKNRGDSVTNDITTLKYSPEGTVIWTSTYSETAVSDDLVFDMAVDSGGSIYLSGSIASTADPEGPQHVPLVLHYDANGQLLRAVQEGSTGNGWAVAIDPVGDVYVATESTLYKYDSALGAIRSVGLVGNLGVVGLLVNSANDVFVAGTIFDPFTFVRDYHTTKVTAGGQVLWSHRFNGTGNRDDVAAGAAIDGANNVLVTGTSWGNYVSSGGTADDIVTLKFFASGGTPPPPPIPQPPVAPGGLSATALSRTQIRLSWADNSNNETGFSIERCTGAGCTNFAAVRSVPAGTTTLVDTGLSRRTTYRYRVRAVNAAGASGYSNIASATTAR